MAKTTIDIEIQTNVSGESVKDLRQQFNEVEDALFEMAGAGKQNTEEFRKLQKEAAKIKERVDDLNESIDMLKPEAKFQAIANLGAGVASGFAAAQGAAQLFGQENEALDKSLAKVQAAMALAQGVQGLAGMGDSLRVVGTMLKSTTLGTQAATVAQRIYNAVMKDNPIAWLIMGLTALVGVIALVVNAMGDEDEAQKEVIANREKELQLMQEADKAMQKETDFRKSLAEAQGKSAQELAALNEELSKQRIKRIDEEIKTANKLFKDRLVLMKNTSGDEYIELQKANSDTLKLMKDLANERLDIQRNLQIQNAKLETEANKASAEKSKQRVIEKKEESNKEFEDALAEAERLSNIEIEKEKKLEEQRAARLKQMRDQEIAEQIKADEEYGKLLEEKAKKEEEEEKKALENKKKAKEQEVALTLQGLQSIQSLADAFAGKSEASQKKAFQIKKAASLAQATIETYQAAQSAFASQMAIPTPDAPIRANIAAAIAIASGLARVAVIAKTKFEGGGGGASGGGGGGNLGTFSQGGGGGQPPQGLTSQNTVTQLNPDGTVAGQGNREAAPMKAYVVESESRAVTERVNKLSNNSKIG
jgi:hypothetical protein